VRFVDRPEWRELGGAGIGKNDIDPALLGLDLREEPVEVGKARDISLHARDVRAERLDSIIHLVLAASGDGDMRAFCGEPFLQWRNRCRWCQP
jgi:hypothetical protein